MVGLRRILSERGECPGHLLYVMTRSIGIPFFGPHAGHTEPIGAVDLAAAATELGLIVLLTTQLDGVYRMWASRGVLALAVITTLIVGNRGLFGAPLVAATPARVGETVTVPGGLLRLDRVAPEQMAPMQAGNFAGSGMNMSGMGMDMAPQGYRRFTVELTLAGQARGGLRYTADQFTVAGTDLPETGTYRHWLGNGTVPAGSAVAGSLLFQVPESADQVLLSFRGAEQAFVLDLGPNAHGHGAPHTDIDGGQHTDDHEH
jgi:hypothetical protein